MLFWATISLMLAFGCALVGFGEAATDIAGIAKALAVIFLLLFVAAVVAHAQQERRPPG